MSDQQIQWMTGVPKTGTDLRLQHRLREISLLIPSEDALDVDEEVDRVVVRDDGDQKLAADSAHDRRRRKKGIAGDIDDPPHGIDLQADDAGSPASPFGRSG
jgi:hypothetical protein